MIRSVYPVVARLGPFTLHTYTLLVDLGIAAALAWLYFRAPEGKTTRWLDTGLAATVGAFAGARLLYAVVNGNYYLPHLDEIFQIWQGGLAWPGAVFGGLASAWLYCSRKREPLSPVIDALALPIAFLGLLGWAGCLAAGCAYGYEVAPGQIPAWMASDAPDLYGLTVPRFPTQAFGVTWGVITLGLVWGTVTAARNRHWPVGAQSPYALSLVALGAFFLGFTRGDPMPFIRGYRLDVIGSGLVLLASSLIWAWLVSRRPPALPATPNPNPNFNSNSKPNS